MLSATEKPVSSDQAGLRNVHRPAASVWKTTSWTWSTTPR